MTPTASVERFLPAEVIDQRDGGRLNARSSLSWIALADGTAVPIRPIHPRDAPALQRFHQRLTETSVRFRFFHAMPLLSDDMAREFTALDGINQFALVALDPEAKDEIIAVVRFIREPGASDAEYAAIVADGWQGRGLGLALTRCLIRAARARGIEKLTAYILPDNARMLHLLQDLGVAEDIHHESGTVIVTISIE